MGKLGKVLVFIIVSFILIIIATVMKETGPGAFLSIAAIAILILYKAMFKKSNPDESTNSNDITLEK